LVTNYYQSGPGTIREHAVMETIVLLMEEPIFDTLHTLEQLGYAVNLTPRNTYGVFGLSVTVLTQATKFTADHVDQRIENFFPRVLIRPSHGGGRG
jgi:nardilysin